MDFQFTPFEPPPALRPILRRSFYARGRIPYRSDKILPNGLAVAIFNRGAPHRVGKAPEPRHNPAFAHSWLHGVQTTPIFNTPGAETHVVGLVFEPPGLHALTGVDMRALADRTVDARNVLPPLLLGRIVDDLPALATAAAHRALHDTLLAHAATAPQDWLAALYAQIRESRGAVRLGEAYAATGLSARHVTARFRAAVGVSPKVLCRIYRLQALLEAVDPAAPVNWTALAHAHGFYDQAHFNRDFRAFSGLHPAQYLAQRRRDLPQLGRGESVHFAPQR